ncbi:MAG: SsrA-binding protein SmpB [Erysipelothrix sp.]|nr:SsrA-binding protein SmpB [Erysipelothrix sp.]
MKTVATNRKARHEYFIKDTYESGMVLTGTEIKSIRQGKVTLQDSYVSIINNEAFIVNMHIAQYDQGNRFNHEETRTRKLLLHKREIQKLNKATQQQGYTIIPLSLYLSKGLAKLEIAVAEGKKLYDKRQSEKERTIKRELQKEYRK